MIVIIYAVYNLPCDGEDYKYDRKLFVSEVKEENKWLEKNKMNLRDILKNELKENHNNIITVMENHIMQMIRCDRHTANLVVNEVLELDRQAEEILSE